MNLAPGEKLAKRYQIIARLGQGGFGQTFLAEDEYLPGKQKCVVKQLKPQASDPFTLESARRLFATEAEILHQLGNHPQIPQLFAYFEENQEFYLVQEYIEGFDLGKELEKGEVKSEEEVILLLKEILTILEFVHQYRVIHRDLNPYNLIRRQKDSKLVLIDFGAVKQISTQVVQQGQSGCYTIAIGTPGYFPSEQAKGFPKLSSDIYAVGTIGIQALTGHLPHQLPIDPETVELNWHNLAKVSPSFAQILDKMVRYDFRERYQTATEALQALNALTSNNSATVALSNSQSNRRLNKGNGKKNSLLSKFLLAIAVIGFATASTLAIHQFLQANNANNLVDRADTLSRLDRDKEALDYYDRALKIRPNYDRAWKGKGDTLAKLKRDREALAAYEQAIQLQPNSQRAWLGRAKVLVNLGKNEEAIAAFYQVLKLDNDSWEAWQGLANLQMKLKQYSEAISSYDRMLDIKRNDAFAWYQRGWALHNLGRYEPAIESYDRAVEFKPNFAQALYQKGNILILFKRYDEAIEAFDRAVRFEPQLDRAWYGKGIALNYLKRYEEAINAFDRAVKLKSNDYEGWYNLGWAFAQTNRYRDAIAAYDKAIRFKANYALAWYNRGNAFYNLGEYSKAISSYDRAVENDKKYYQAWNSRGNALFNLKNYQEAILSYEEALRYKPDYTEARSGKEKAESLLNNMNNDSKLGELNNILKSE
jgi:tetratricopeptide (TPR) repeat protein